MLRPDQPMILYLPDFCIHKDFNISRRKFFVTLLVQFYRFLSRSRTGQITPFLPCTTIFLVVELAIFHTYISCPFVLPRAWTFPLGVLAIGRCCPPGTSSSTGFKAVRRRTCPGCRIFKALHATFAIVRFIIVSSHCLPDRLRCCTAFVASRL